MRYILLFIISTYGLSIHAEVFTASYEYELKQQEFIEKMKTVGAKLTEADRAIMKAAHARVVEELKTPGLKLGQKAPDFTLNNAFGKSVKLSDMLKKGPVVLVFYRGGWCPYCNLHLKVLQESLPEFKKHGANLLTVTPQKPDKTLQQFKENTESFEVLSDLSYDVMKEYNLYFEVPDEIKEVYKKIPIDIESYNGEGRMGLPVPASFVLDQQGTIRAMHADTSYWKRMEPKDIIEALVAIETGK